MPVLDFEGVVPSLIQGEVIISHSFPVNMYYNGDGRRAFIPLVLDEQAVRFMFV